LGELHEGFHAFQISDIQPVKVGGFCSGFSGGADHRFQPVLTARPEQQFGSERAQSLGRCRAKAAGGTGNEHPFIMERRTAGGFHTKTKDGGA
jgi:hypothetical protein